MTHPYRGIEDYRFWSKAMTSPAPGHVDPVTRSQLIGPDQKIATMGSCFAQHLARHISQSGLHYFVPESAPAGLGAEEAARRNYGVFSARYGNVYTVRQAVQLFDRAFGAFAPQDAAWQRADGRWVDAFRPQVEPDGHESPHAVAAAALEHLTQVRAVFAECDWLVFTLGLTEAWRSTLDGAVYPLAPGVAGGNYDPERHEFVNFTVNEVWADLQALVHRTLAVNPKARILLTVSPVPLAATFEPRHVLSSTVCSKAILRVAADQAERTLPQVLYFPSLEIITSPAAGGRYYADDLRQVTELGVSHVMRVFSKHFIEPSDVLPAVTGLRPAPFGEEVICDEEAIEDAIRASGVDHGSRRAGRRSLP